MSDQVNAIFLPAPPQIDDPVTADSAVYKTTFSKAAPFKPGGHQRISMPQTV